MTNILGLTPPELALFLTEMNLPASVLPRLLKALYRVGVDSLEECSDLSIKAKSKLAEKATAEVPKMLHEYLSSDGQTRKVLFEFSDGNVVETVLMSALTSAGRWKSTICVSTQVGCAIGCPFCATGQQGYTRNLTTAEIIGQIVFFTRRLRQSKPGERFPTNLVFMGMGEPLLNFEAVRRAIDIAGSGFALGASKIMLSSAGIVPQIRQLSKAPVAFELAVSLHSATNKLRNRLVPINCKYPIEELIDACREYTMRTKRRVYMEYALFRGVNDSHDDADALLKLLSDLPCAVNLLIGNPSQSNEYVGSSVETAWAFQARLVSGGLRAMLRVARGTDIDAGCGQLRARTN